jgi:pimeloyl-ACP methyl ester carboxylesterase
MHGRRRALVAGIACAVTALGAQAAIAAPGAPRLAFKRHCGPAKRVTCATVKVPADYDRPGGRQYRLHVAKSPATDRAHRIGTLFINFGGPGGTTADLFEANGADLFPALNRRFDIIAMDPRGVGQSRPAIDCKVDQETVGLYREPFTTPATLHADRLVSGDRRYVRACERRNGSILSHVSTANVARDMDRVRRGLGAAKITYYGFSYGTFLGATYARLFPRHYRAMVLDGPVDAQAYINDPLRDLSAQSSGFERAYGRFMQACAHDPVACSGFGAASGDPWNEFDRLAGRLDAAPLKVGKRRLDGDDLRAGAALALYSKHTWGDLGLALTQAELGDGSGMLAFADSFFGRNSNGSYDPAGDRYFAIGAAEQRYAHPVSTFLHAGARSWEQHEHFWFNNGYVELDYGLYPSHDRDAYHGSFRLPRGAPVPLVVATTYDPATPYRGARNLARELGRARVLTMRGDGHTAYGESACIDSRINRYVDTRVLPRKGRQCAQDTRFTAPKAGASARGTSAWAARVAGLRPHTRPQR